MSSFLKSTFNTRALPTGNLRYIRSDFPERLTDDEVAWLRKNDVMTIVDLRERKEYEQKPCRLEGEEGFIYYHLPVTGGADTPESPEAVAAAYLGMLDDRMKSIIGTIMNAKSNVLYFCSAGKDRTGVVSAVILNMLGYDDQTIIDDYMKTKENLSDFLRAYVEEHPEVDLKTIVPNEENIKKVLTALKQVKNIPGLETERLILRRWEDSDAENLFEYAKDPDVGPIAGWPAHQSIEESREVIRNVFNGKEAYAICLKTDNRAIGAIELKLNGHTDMTDRDDECELGYWLGKPFWGQGIVPEAVKEMLRHAFEDIGMTKVWVGYYEGNTKSRRVQEKCGFRSQWKTEDVDVPLMHEKRTGYVSSITKDQWQWDRLHAAAGAESA